MESIEKPIARLSEAAKWFVVAEELRALHVVTSTSLRIGALETIAAAEYVERNKRPFVVLEIPPDGEKAGWDLLAEELRADLTELRENFLAENPASQLLAPLPPPITSHTGIVRFGLELANALATVRKPLEGLVIVFAPVRVDDPSGWCDALATLLRPRELERARFVVVDLESDVSGPAFGSLGARLERCDARLDPEEARRDMDGMLEAMRTAPPDAAPSRRVGLAAPRETPPLRKNQPKPAPPEQLAAQLQQMGVAPAIANPTEMQTLRLLVLAAAQAMSRKDPLTATEQQRKAAELAERLGLEKQALQFEMMAGAYALQSSALKPAYAHFVRVRDKAEAKGYGDVAAQAQMSIATTLLLQKRRDEAIAAYAHAAVLAAKLGSPPLAIEGYRMAGQLLAEDNRLEEAATAFRRAIETAEALPPEARLGNTAPEAARALAKLCRTHGMTVQADALEAQAARLEAMPGENAEGAGE